MADNAYPPGLAIALGGVDRVTSFHQFGRVSEVDTNSDPEDVWNGTGLYTGHPIGAAEVIEVFSSDAADAAAGTGLRTVRLTGQLAGVVQTEEVTLDGVTGVDTSLLWDRCYLIEGLTAGSGGKNAGTITVRHKTTTANVFVLMPIGANRSHVCAFTVPLAKTLYLSRWDMRIARSGGNAGSAQAAIMARNDEGVYRELFPTEVVTGGPELVDFDSSQSFDALTDIVARILSVSDDNTIATSHLFGVLVDG